MGSRQSIQRTLCVRRSGGVFLVFSALTLTALLLLIVAAIDVSRLYNSQTELERTAQAACLGALEQFLVDRGINNQVRDRLSAAVKRAEAMVGINVALSIGNLSGRSNDLQDALGFPEDGGEEANGMLELGRWRYEDPKLPQGQPSCWYDQGVNPRPCFDSVPLCPTGDCTEEEATITAARISLKTNPASAIRFFFGAILGREAFTVSARAQCSIAPRHVAVAIDLSRSMYPDSHPPHDGLPNAAALAGQPGGPAEYVYFFGSAARWAVPNDFCPFNTEFTEWEEPPVSCFDPNSRRYCNLPNQNDNNQINCCPLIFQGGGTEAEELFRALLDTRRYYTGEDQHFKDDYICVYPVMRNCRSYRDLRDCLAACQNPDDGDQVGCYNTNPLCTWDTSLPNGEGLHCSQRGGRLLLDNHSVMNGGGPQPLYSVFSGVNRLLRIFRERAVVGDRAALLGFSDTSFIPSRVFPPSPPNSISFRDMELLTDVDEIQGTNWVDARSQEFKRSFFPYEIVNTDLPMALRTAFMLLSDAQREANAQASVVVVSDFITNCRQLAGSDPQQSPQPLRDCGSTYRHFQDSASEIASIINEFFVPARVKVHLAIVGTATAPHTALLKGANGCMDSSEAQLNAAPNFVNPGSGNQSSSFVNYPRATFYEPNKFYQSAVLPTGGSWMPLRRSCCDFADDPQSCGLSELQGTINDACRQSSAQNMGDVLLPSEIADLQSSISQAGFDADKVLDGEARLLCDPQGRSTAEQMGDYMEKLMGENTMVLVGP